MASNLGPLPNDNCPSEESASCGVNITSKKYPLWATLDFVGLAAYALSRVTVWLFRSF